MNCFMGVMKDDDHLIRASAVSNLGEMCKLLRYSLTGILWEVRKYNKWDRGILLEIKEVLFCSYNEGHGMANIFRVFFFPCDPPFFHPPTHPFIHPSNHSSIHSFITVCASVQVVSCISGLLRGDPAVEVRQGAAMLINLLLQGLGKDAFKVINREAKSFVSNSVFYLFSPVLSNSYSISLKISNASNLCLFFLSRYLKCISFILIFPAGFGFCPQGALSLTKGSVQDRERRFCSYTHRYGKKRTEYDHQALPLPTTETREKDTRARLSRRFYQFMKSASVIYGEGRCKNRWN